MKLIENPCLDYDQKCDQFTQKEYTIRSYKLAFCIEDPEK